MIHTANHAHVNTWEYLPVELRVMILSFRNQMRAKKATVIQRHVRLFQFVTRVYAATGCGDCGDCYGCMSQNYPCSRPWRVFTDDKHYTILRMVVYLRMCRGEDEFEWMVGGWFGSLESDGVFFGSLGL